MSRLSSLSVSAANLLEIQNASTNRLLCYRKTTGTGAEKSVCATLHRMKISREDVLRVAELAHLELTAEEVELYRGQLDEILSYIGKLEELDVSKVEPMAQVLFGAPGGSHPELRDDTPSPCDVADAVLAQAPEAAKPFFRVPKVIER
ncbi:MAG: Asp-tRNA(Asn)/Glu-tRNA(Gln) amidotransferase subunit GatC [Candidatus Acidiferrales bacterium]